MAKPKIYCDANIYLDLFENRKDRLRDLGEFAHQLLRRTLECEFDLIISDWLLFELKQYVKVETLTEFLEQYKQKNKIIKVAHTPEDIRQAKLISSHYQDALHQILAKRGGAKYLVTRNVQDFTCDSDLQIKFPENI
jgi:predicted nucleic acid-binding protein